MSDLDAPTPRQLFAFGLRTVGNRGRDPIGEPARPGLSPVDIVHLRADVGAYGVDSHDIDLGPIDATPTERNRIVKGLQQALREPDPLAPSRAPLAALVPRGGQMGYDARRDTAGVDAGVLALPSRDPPP